MASPDRTRIAWLYRRLAFGLTPGELDRLETAGYDAAVARLLAPDAHGVPAAPPPFDEALLAASRTPNDRTAMARIIWSWLDTFRTTPRPLEAWMAWFWHGHFVSGLDKVSIPWLMANQIRLFHRAGLGSFKDLTRAVTVDPAMLSYLDGATSTGNAPNENYGRELQELFTVGIGHYTEADVHAAAVALTGWRIRRADGSSFFEPPLHDDTPQTLQGRAGVHDVDSVVEAVTSAPNCAAFVAGKLTRAVLGLSVDESVVTRAAAAFHDSGLDVTALLSAIVQAGPDASTPLAAPPVPWLVNAERAMGVVLPPSSLGRLRRAGQLPMLPPNVGGWPGGDAWFASSTVVARYGLAGILAGRAPATNPARMAAEAGDIDRLADALGRPEGFSDPTASALENLRREAKTDPSVAVLTVALTSPDMAVL